MRRLTTVVLAGLASTVASAAMAQTLGIDFGKQMDVPAAFANTVRLNAASSTPSPSAEISATFGSNSATVVTTPDQLTVFTVNPEMKMAGPLALEPSVAEGFAVQVETNGPAPIAEAETFSKFAQTSPALLGVDRAALSAMPSGAALSVGTNVRLGGK